jgi:hypothetical protein
MTEEDIAVGVMTAVIWILVALPGVLLIGMRRMIVMTVGGVVMAVLSVVSYFVWIDIFVRVRGLF